MITHHGIYIPQGIIPIISKKQKIPFYVWQPGYRQNSLIVTKNKNVHKYFPENKSWKKFVLNDRQKNKLKLSQSKGNWKRGLDKFSIKEFSRCKFKYFIK